MNHNPNTTSPTSSPTTSTSTPETATQTTPPTALRTTTPYKALGGAPAVRRLVDRFYQLMDELPEAYTVRRIHPESLAGSAESLFEFLSGWFGGPPLYQQKKGHPRLRMRHNPYAVGQVERDEWMLCMTQALNEQVDDSALCEALIQTFASMADHLINTGGAGVCNHANTST